MPFDPLLTIYVKRQRAIDWGIYANVCSMKEGWRLRPDGLYRDASPASPGKLDYFAAAPASPITIGTEVPVIGKPGETPASSIDLTKLIYLASDEQTHTPPRQRYVLENGLYVAIIAAVIPDALLPTSHAFTFSASNTTDELTGVAHGFSARDRVTASIATNGFSTTTIYTVVKLTADTLKLLKPDGTLLDVTTGTVSVTLSLIDTQVPPVNLPEGVFFIPAPYDLSFNDPR